MTRGDNYQLSGQYKIFESVDYIENNCHNVPCPINVVITVFVLPASILSCQVCISYTENYSVRKYAASPDKMHVNSVLPISERLFIERLGYTIIGVMNL